MFRVGARDRASQPRDEQEAPTLSYVQSSGMRSGFATMAPGPGAMKLGVTMSWKDDGLRTPVDRIQAEILSAAMLSHTLYLNDMSWRSALPILSLLEIKILTWASNGYNDKMVEQHVRDEPTRVHERWRRTAQNTAHEFVRTRCPSPYR